MRYAYAPDDIAKTLYEMTTDMDYADYEDTKEEDIRQLCDALYQIQAIAENDHNADYWRTLWNCLQMITDSNISYEEM